MTAVTQHVASIDHDSLLNYVAAEHVDWAQDQTGSGGAGQIDAANIPADSGFSSIVTETTTARTLILTDGDNKYIRMTNAATSVITVPTNASVAFALETEISGVGTQETVSFDGASSGIIINDFLGLTDFRFWALKQVATDEWDLVGSN